MYLKAILLSTLLGLALTGTACDRIGELNPFRQQESLAAPVEELDLRITEASNRFGLALYLSLASASADENIMISPASISTALAMTYNGAGGETKAEMARVLGFDQLSLEELNLAYADLLTILNNPDPDVELTVANSLWALEGVDFYPDFLERNQEYFGAEVASLDFSDSAAADRINTWVEEHTRGRIKNLIEPPISEQTILFLINAIYFKGAWTEPFDPDRTVEQTFYRADGKTSDCLMMYQNGEFFYREADHYQAVKLPLGQNERVSMNIYLPAEESSLADFLALIAEPDKENWQGVFFKREGQVGLPRFSFEYEKSLNESLKALGMESAFAEDRSDFSAMRPEPPNLFISEVKHKNFIEVNEEGAEAAAATSVEIMPTSAPPEEPFVFVADRPFFFTITDNTTGLILFIGSLNDPA